MRLADKYDEWDDPCTHLVKWTKVYREEPQPEWVYLFYHTMDVIPMNWYTEMKLWHGTSEWDILRKGFLLTFMFEYHWWDIVYDALQVAKAVILKIPQDLIEMLQSECATQLSCTLEC